MLFKIIIVLSLFIENNIFLVILNNKEGCYNFGTLEKC